MPKIFQNLPESYADLCLYKFWEHPAGASLSIIFLKSPLTKTLVQGKHVGGWVRG